MLSKNQVKFIHSLRLKKFREENNLFAAEGTKIVMDIINSPIKVRQIFSTKDFIGKIFSENQKDNEGLKKVDIIEVSENELKKISNLTSPNEVLAIAEIPKHELSIDILPSRLTLALDQICDPGNLGTIIRIADWFGIENIICSQDTVDTFNSKVIQSTMGSITRVRVHYKDLELILKGLQNKISIYGALLEGENIYKKKLKETGLILIGNESRGISKKLLPYLTDKITIPQTSFSKEAGMSLNAAIAAGIICSEFRRN